MSVLVFVYVLVLLVSAIGWVPQIWKLGGICRMGGLDNPDENETLMRGDAQIEIMETPRLGVTAGSERIPDDIQGIPTATEMNPCADSPTSQNPREK